MVVLSIGFMFSTMARLSHLALLSIAACSAATEIVILAPGNKNLLFAPPAGIAPKGAYTLRHDASHIEVPLDFGFPVRPLRINDIKPQQDPFRPNEMVCCPPGTFFDPRTQQCAFLASSICPPGFMLDSATKSICISETPPCPGDLFLENGRCISHELPTCPDPAATLDMTTFECVSISPPKCDSPFKAIGPSCVSDHKPTCDLGFHQDGSRCVLISGPTCGPPELGLVVRAGKDGKPVCVSTKPPICPDGSQPDHDKCTVIEEPRCPAGFENIKGSCIFKGSLCPQGGEFTTFPDERAPVCRTTEMPMCELGELQGNLCVSKRPPCPAEFTLTEDKLCTRTEPIQCQAGSKVFFPPPSNFDRGDEPKAFCCPDLPGMTLDRRGLCSFPSTTRDCPAGMEPDRANERCIFTPQPENCPRGKLDPTTGLCTEITDPDCKLGGGEPDPATGKCKLGKPTCPSAAQGAVYDEVTNKCHLTEDPVCPPGSRPIAGQCISDATSTCPEGSTHSPDNTKCIFAAPPDCNGKGHYDKNLQLCIVPNKPFCDTTTLPPPLPGVPPPEIDMDGLTCVSPSRPACPPGTGTTFDKTTNSCISKTPPRCDEHFHFNEHTSQCVSNAPPVCSHLGLGFILSDGKCISDTPPVCPEKSAWVPRLMACVSDTSPCPENTPTIDGKCVSSVPPTCKVAGTSFVAGVGCVSDNVKPKCVEGTKLNEATGECVTEAKCGDPDLEVRDGLCVSVSKKPQCPGGMDPNTEGKCVTRTPPECDRAKELTFDRGSGKCVGGPPRCPDKTQLDLDLAKCITASARTCFALLACPDVVDSIGPPGIEGE